MFSVLSGRGLGANGACLQLQNYVCLTGTNTKLELLYIQILHDVTRLLCTFFPFRIFETKSTWKHMPDRLSAHPFNRNSPKAFQVSTASPSQYLGRMVSCTFYFIPLYLRVYVFWCTMNRSALYVANMILVPKGHYLPTVNVPANEIP